MRNRANHTGGATYDQIFRAIGDPHRLQILTLLREKELSAGEILKAIDVVQSTLSHHMKNLTDAGVVNAARHGKWTYYSLNTEALTDVIRFLGEFSEGTREFAHFAKEEESPAPVPKAQPSEQKSVKEPKEKEKEKKAKKGKKGKKSKK